MVIADYEKYPATRSLLPASSEGPRRYTDYSLVLSLPSRLQVLIQDLKCLQSEIDYIDALGTERHSLILSGPPTPYLTSGCRIALSVTRPNSFITFNLLAAGVSGHSFSWEPLVTPPSFLVLAEPITATPPLPDKRPIICMLHNILQEGRRLLFCPRTAKLVADAL